MERIAAKVGTIFIPVMQLARSMEWYKEMFDLNVLDQKEDRIFMQFPQGETAIVLWKVEKPQPVYFETGKHKMHYWNFDSYDIESSYRQLVAKGVTVTELVYEEEHGHRFFDAYDPDGNIVNIVEVYESNAYYDHKQTIR